MKLPRRKFLHLAAGAAVLPAVSRSAWAQTYPSRPITMIVPFAPGGLTDVIGRVMAEGMRTTLGTRSGPERCSPLMKSQRGTRHLAAMLLAIPRAPHPARRYLSLDTTRRCVRRRSGRPDSRGFAVTFAHAMTALGHPTKLRADLL